MSRDLDRELEKKYGIHVPNFSGRRGREEDKPEATRAGIKGTGEGVAEWPTKKWGLVSENSS